MLVAALCAPTNLIENPSRWLGSESVLVSRRSAQVSKVIAGCTETQRVRGKTKEEKKETDSCKRR